MTPYAQSIVQKKRQAVPELILGTTWGLLHSYVQGVPLEVSVKAPAGLLNMRYRINDNGLYLLTSCINTGLPLLFPFHKHHFQYFA
jgi:hypothetical protein